MTDYTMIEKAICDFFGVSQEKVREKNHLKEESIVRGYLYYYLHSEQNVSPNAISQIYGRNRRGVARLIAKTKYYIENIKNNTYEDMKKAVAESMYSFTTAENHNTN